MQSSRIMRRSQPTPQASKGRYIKLLHPASYTSYYPSALKRFLAVSTPFDLHYPSARALVAAPVLVCASAPHSSSKYERWRAHIRINLQMRLKNRSNVSIAGRLLVKCVYKGIPVVSTIQLAQEARPCFSKGGITQSLQRSYLFVISPELPLLLVNTRQQRSTAVEVAKVGALKKSLPEVTERVLDAIDKITETAHSIITDEGFDKTDEQTAEKLGEMMRVNHGLLVSLGVSHPRIERIRELVDDAGLGWTKLTGAGGGGSTITLLKPGYSPKALKELEKKLEAENFERFEITLGGDGVGVLWPAVLKKGDEDEEAGGEEIDQEKFLKATGREGVEETRWCWEERPRRKRGVEVLAGCLEEEMARIRCKALYH